MKRLHEDSINTPDWWDALYTRLRARTAYFAYPWLLTRPELLEGRSVLDLGCGVATGLAWLKAKIPSMLPAGADFSPYALAKARKRYPKIPFMSLDIANDQIPTAGTILIMQTLEHLMDPVGVVKRCLRKCKTLVVSVPRGSTLSREPSHLWSFGQHDFSELEPEVCIDRARLVFVFEGGI